MTYLNRYAELLSHGVELAEEIYELVSSSSEKAAVAQLAAILPITLTDAGRFVRTAVELFGPTNPDVRSLRDETIAQCREQRMDFTRLVIVGMMVRKIPRKYRRQRENLRRELVATAMTETLAELKTRGNHLARELRGSLPDQPRPRAVVRNSATASADGTRRIVISGPDACVSRIVAQVTSRAKQIWKREEGQRFEEAKFIALEELLSGSVASRQGEEPTPLDSLVHQPAVIITAPELNRDRLIDDEHGRSWFATTDGAMLPLSEYVNVALADQGWAVVVDGDCNVMDLQRIARVFSPAQKAAQAMLQAVCAAPNCSRPAVFAEGHHLKEWHKGGTTTMHNLGLLCSSCHAKVGDLHGALERTDDGRFCWRSPDGSTHVSRLPIEEVNGIALSLSTTGSSTTT